MLDYTLKVESYMKRYFNVTICDIISFYFNLQFYFKFLLLFFVWELKILTLNTFNIDQKLKYF